MTEGETMACSLCNHEHATMARVSNSKGRTLYYCHEEDHSCYTDRWKDTKMTDPWSEARRRIVEDIRREVDRILYEERGDEGL